MEEEDAEAEAAEGMTQLAASRSVPASSSFGNIADISPVLALGRSLILVSSQVPQEVCTGLALPVFIYHPVQHLHACALLASPTCIPHSA